MSLPSSFNIFIPPLAHHDSPVPVIIFLTGLTGDENRAIKETPILDAACAENVAVIFPDTSPRGANVPGEGDDYRVGLNAGWYINAETPKWRKHYRMYDTICYDLLEWVNQLQLDVMDLTRVSIMGESMGGHGALVIYLRNLDRFRSASGLCPICNPARSTMGATAFSRLLAPGTADDPPAIWKSYDSCHLISTATAALGSLDMLIDVGREDHLLLAGQLGIQELAEAAVANGRTENQVEINYNAGFDHSYTFVAAFVGKHIQYHAKTLWGSV